MKDTVKLLNKKQTLMVAHRGASGLERENTLPAFLEAAKRSFYGIECDIHYTKDGQFVVYHDDTTERLCDGEYNIEETDFNTLRSLKIKDTDAETFSVLRMPTYDEYLDIIKESNKIGFVELKLPMPPAAIKKAVDMTKSHGALDNVVFISFFLENLLAMRELLPNHPAQFLRGGEVWDDTWIERLKAHKIGLDVGFWLLTKERVQEAHKHGVKVNCWTCDEKQTAEQLIDWGVDFITTNIIE